MNRVEIDVATNVATTITVVAYKDGVGNLLCLDAGAQPPAGYTQITDAEYWSLGAPPTPVPQSVTRFQAQAALYNAGMLAQVDTLMADVATPMVAKLAWQSAQDFERSSPTVASMAAALNLTSAQLDQLFIAAAQIKA